MPKNHDVIELELVDVRGRTLQEEVTVVVEQQNGDHRWKRTGLTAAGLQLRQGPRRADALRRGRHRVRIDAPSYCPVVRILEPDPHRVVRERFVFPIDPDKVDSVTWPDYASLPAAVRALLTRSRKVLAFEGKYGASLYKALDDIRRAGFLNITAKAQATAFRNRRTVLDYLLKLAELRGDRFFVSVPKELREETKNSIGDGLFHEVDGGLHHPPAGFSPAGSFKTPDGYGNLQLTFFASGEEWVADIDIDDAAGLEHLFQVVRNWVTGRPTHPYDIHQILVARQGLSPGYELVV
jgi:hypothetical protein